MMTTPELIDLIPDGLFWKLRHTALFIINAPFRPLFLLWMWIMATYADLIGCVTCDGSNQIEPFWKWNWKDEDDDL